MARCCAVINGDGITGTLILHQAQEEAPTTIDGSFDRSFFRQIDR